MDNDRRVMERYHLEQAELDTGGPAKPDWQFEVS